MSDTLRLPAMLSVRDGHAESSILVAERETPVMPYRGIAPFRFIDEPIFFGREQEADELLRMVLRFRGVLFYGDSGAGKSSLLNARFLPHAMGKGLLPNRIRLQPELGAEMVIERISLRNAGTAPFLPSSIVAEGNQPSRVVLSSTSFYRRVRRAAVRYGRGEGPKPLLIFDQFEEFITQFEVARRDESARRKLHDAQTRILKMIVRLLCERQLPVKLLFSFREDYFAKIEKLLAQAPGLVEQRFRLLPPLVSSAGYRGESRRTADSPDLLPQIIEGPLEVTDDSGDRVFAPHLPRELCAELARSLRARAKLGFINLSEVQIACRELWKASDPVTLFRESGVEGLIESFSRDAFEQIRQGHRDIAVVVLGQMVTTLHTRNIVSRESLLSRVSQEEKTSQATVLIVLEQLEEVGFVRQELRHDTEFYEIVSEFLVPWIEGKQEELKARRLHARELQESEAERQKLQEEFEKQMEDAALRDRLASAEKTSAIFAATQEERELRLRRTHQSLVLLMALVVALSLLGIGSYLQFRAKERAAVAAEKAAARQLELRLQAEEAKGRLGEEKKKADAARKAAELAQAAAENALQAKLQQEKEAAAARAQAAAAEAERSVLPQFQDVFSQAVLTGHRGAVRSVSFSPNGDLLLTGGSDGLARLWDLNGQPRGKAIEATNGAVAVTAFRAKSGQFLLGSQGGSILLYELGTVPGTNWISGFRYEGHRGWITEAVFAPEGSMILSGGEDGTVQLWEPRKEGKVLPLMRHDKAVRHVEFSPDGKRILSSGDDNTVRVWDAASGEALQVLHSDLEDPTLRRALFSPDESRIVALAPRGLVLWDGRSYAPSGLWELPAAPSYAAFHPRGDRIAVGDAKGNAWILQLSDGKKVELPGHTDAITKLAWSRSGALLATASRDGTARVWSFASSRPVLLAALRGHKGPILDLAFSSKGTQLATAGSDGTARLWNPETKPSHSQWVTYGKRNQDGSWSDLNFRIAGPEPMGMPKKDDPVIAQIAVNTRTSPSVFVQGEGWTKPAEIGESLHPRDRVVVQEVYQEKRFGPVSTIWIRILR